jgi:threonine/homoserine/homoserine lactone efflux protein
MTITWLQMLLYAGGLVVLVATPGPVVVALVARSVSAGFRSSLALSAGVIVGDLVYPLFAIFGLAVIAEVWADFLTMLRYAGAGILIWMGWRLITGRAEGVDPTARKVRRRGVWESFLAGLLVNLGNPKSIIFFMGLLPGFFDVADLTTPDVVVIVAMSGLVPFLGNLVWAGLAARAGRLLSSATAVRRVNIGAGGVLAGVGVAIAAR